MEASADIAPTLVVPDLEELATELHLDATEPWKVTSRFTWSVTGKVTIPQVDISSHGGGAWLAVDGDPSTGVVRGDLVVKRGDGAKGKEVTTFKYGKATITIRKNELDLKLPIECTFLPSINTWWVIGPFDAEFAKALDTPFPPDDKIDLEAKYEGKDKKPVGWRQLKRPLTPDTNLADEFFIDFDDVFGGRVYQAVAYALAYLHAPEDMDATLALGTDDGVLVRLNGKEVWRVDEGRAYLSKQDHVPVQLKKGVNTLLLKIKQGGGDWGFCVHVEDAKGKPLTQVRPSLSAEPIPSPAP